jgi:hypothetical protein
MWKCNKSVIIIQFFILTCWLNSYWRQLQSQQLYFASVPVTSSGTAVRLFCNPSTHRHSRNGTPWRPHLTCVAQSSAYQVEQLRVKLQSAFYEKVPAGGNVYCWVDYRAAIGGKQYDASGGYTVTYRLKSSRSWEQRVVSAPVLCTVLLWWCSTVNHIEFIRTHESHCLLFVQWLWNKCSQEGSSNSSRAEKSCACAYIAFLAGIFSLCADSRLLLDARAKMEPWRQFHKTWSESRYTDSLDILIRGLNNCWMQM